MRKFLLCAVAAIAYAAVIPPFALIPRFFGWPGVAVILGVVVLVILLVVLLGGTVILLINARRRPGRPGRDAAGLPGAVDGEVIDKSRPRPGLLLLRVRTADEEPVRRRIARWIAHRPVSTKIVEWHEYSQGGLLDDQVAVGDHFSAFESRIVIRDGRTGRVKLHWASK